MHNHNFKNVSLGRNSLKVFHRIIMVFSIVFLTSGISACSNNSSEQETNHTQVILKLGGNNCEFYLGAVDTALKKLKGVKDVDLSTQKGHAMVKTDGTLKASQVVDAVDGLSGKGWKCEAELKK